MACARQRRIEAEAHEAARFDCLASAKELGLHMSCEDEFECSAPEACDFYQRALAAAEEIDRMMP